jgi:uncharacterized protein
LGMLQKCVDLNMLKKLVIILLFPFSIFAQDHPASPINYVTDQAGVLGPDEEYRLNAILKAFEDSSSIQLFVYTQNSLNGSTMADLCQEIFHAWKIGNKKTNNGVLIGIFVQDHKFRIHTGYGMEGVLPDLLTKRIQDETMRPYFKEGNYFMGIIEGVNKLMYYSKHEFKPETSVKKEFGLNWRNVLFGYVLNIPLLIIFLYLLFKKENEEKTSSAGKIVLAIFSCVFALAPCIGSVILGFLFLIFRKGKSGSGGTYTSGSNRYFSWGSGGSGSSYDSSSSSSSSDFGGGGGGDSGGGGSDSSW